MRQFGPAASSLIASAHTAVIRAASRLVGTFLSVWAECHTASIQATRKPQPSGWGSVSVAHTGCGRPGLHSSTGCRQRRISRHFRSPYDRRCSPVPAWVGVTVGVSVVARPPCCHGLRIEPLPHMMHTGVSVLVHSILRLLGADIGAEEITVSASHETARYTSLYRWAVL
jgi:hypothetical protein